MAQPLRTPPPHSLWGPQPAVYSLTNIETGDTSQPSLWATLSCEGGARPGMYVPPFPLHQQVRSRSPSSGSVEAFGSWWRLGRAPQELSGQDTKRRAEAEGPYEDKGLSLGAPCRQLHFTSDFQFQLCWPGCVVTLCASDCGQGRRKPLSEPLKAVEGRHQAVSSTQCL